MIRRRLAVCCVLATFAGACASDAPTTPETEASIAAVTTACTADPVQIEALIAQVFTGSVNDNAALGKWNNVKHQLERTRGGLRIAQRRALTLIEFIQLKRAQGMVTSDDAIIADLINQLLCFVGLGTDVEDPDNVWIVRVGDPKTTFVTVDGKSGIQFQSNAVSENTMVIATPSTAAALITELDKYPLVYDWTLVPSQTLQNGNKATVGVCPDPAAFNDVPSAEVQAVLDRLVLGHQKSATAFEVLARVPIPVEMTLTCDPIPTLVAGGSAVSRMLRHAADFILPALAMAAERASTGGVGGNTSEFSPFGPVDPELRVGGVGGNTSEFSRMDNASVAAVLVPIAGTVGTQRTTDLPSVFISTRRGTPIAGVGVAFGAEPPVTLTPVGDASVCGSDTQTDAVGIAAMTCLNFGTTVNYALAYTKLRATFTPPARLAAIEADGDPVVTFTPAYQAWLVESYGPTALVVTSPPTGRTGANGYTNTTSIPVTVEIRSALGEVVPIATSQVNILLNQNAFAAGTVHSNNAVAGIATFSVVIPTPATGYRIIAAAAVAAGSASAESTLFDVISSLSH